jgi:hypothetical protein
MFLSLAVNSNGYIFAGTSNAIVRSTDNGMSWVQVNNMSAGSFAIDSSGHIFAGAGDGVYRSTDDGGTWTKVGGWMLGGNFLSVSSIAINSNGDIFSGTMGGGVFSSTDHGGSWTQVNNGLAYLDVTSLVMNTRDDVFAGTQYGVFRSTDKGSNWMLINNGLTNTDVRSLAINSSGYVFAAANGGGVFRSTKSTNPSIFLSKGWNLVSVPLVQLNESASVIFPNKIGPMFSYNTATRIYQSTVTLANGPGYWLNYPATDTVVFSGTVPGTLTVTATQTGWVLLGSRNRPVQVSSLVMSDGATMVGSVFRYDANLRLYQTSTVINPGEAVWMYISKTSTITIP